MLLKYSLKRTGIMTYSKVEYDNKDTFFYVIVDSEFLYESRIWLNYLNPSITYIGDWGLEIDSKCFIQLINNPNSTFFDLILHSKNAKIFRNRSTAEAFAKEHNFPWTPIKTRRGMRYVIITNPPKCCTLEEILYKEPNNPFV